MKAWFVLCLLLPLCMGAQLTWELACSPHVGLGFIQELHFTPQPKYMKVNWRRVAHKSSWQYSDQYIECYGEDFLMVRNMVLQCRSKVPQACYTRETGEKGCVSVQFCARKGWKCCYENKCNA